MILGSEVGVVSTTVTREHGTYVKYVIDRCRCEDCREANSEYEKKRKKRKAYGGKYWGWTEAEPARQHVLALLSSPYRGANDGIGLKRIAKLSGVASGTISKLIYGNYRGRPPSKRIRLETELKLLSVRPLDENLAAGAVVEAEPVWRMVNELLSFGIPKSRLAEMLGKESGLQLRKRGHVKAFNARPIAEIHWKIFERAPKFRLSCDCQPPYEVLERIEAQDDEARPWVPHQEWEYPNAHRAMLTASRATAGAMPCVVTCEPQDGRDVFRWYPELEYAPIGVEVRATMKNGQWT